MNTHPTSLRKPASLARFNPIRSLTPESLSRQLDEFRAGTFRGIARTWETIERRDDVIHGVAAKRRKAISRLTYEVTQLDDTTIARRHADALRTFYQSLSTTSAVDRNLSGGLPLLLEQMMHAVGHRYAVHEIVWQPSAHGNLSATLYHVPIGFFENRTGRLRFLDTDTAVEGTPLQPDSWMITVGEGLMEPCSVAWMFKQLPLRDWLLYCERNGMPGVKATTDAMPGTDEWRSVEDAVTRFGAEFHGVFSRGTTIEPIDIGSRGQLPYGPLVERMDQAVVALWRGADLTTLSSQGVGASLQRGETEILEQHDARMIADTLHQQLEKPFLRFRFGDEQPRAGIRLLPTQPPVVDYEAFRLLHDLGLPIPTETLYQRLGLTRPASS